MALPEFFRLEPADFEGRFLVAIDLDRQSQTGKFPAGAQRLLLRRLRRLGLSLAPFHLVRPLPLT